MAEPIPQRGPLKRCSRCGHEKPATPAHFVSDRNQRDGLRGICLECKRIQTNESRARTLGRAATGPAATSATPPPARAETPASTTAAPMSGSATSTRPQLVVVLSDVHYEVRWRPLWSGFLAWADEYGADVDTLVLNGDFLDIESASQHGGNPRPPTLLEDVDAAKRGLRELSQRFPNASRVYLEGNHETRVPRFIASNAPTLAGALDVPTLLALDAAGWQWIPTGEQPKRSTWGGLRLIHGHQIRGGGGVVVASTLLNRWWSSPNVTVACGHFHRYSVAVRQAVEGNCSALSLPTMIEPAPAYTSGAHDHWSYGFTIFEVLGAHVRHEAVLANARGQFLYRGRVYGGG